MKIGIQYLGDFLFQARTEKDRQLVLDNIGQGEFLTLEIEKERSVKQNQTYWAVLTKAWLNQRGERWRSVQELHEGALCGVGHCETVTIDVPDGVPDGFVPIMAAFTSQVVKQTRGNRGKYAFARITEAGLAVDIARSWSFPKLKHKDATELFDKVVDWLVEHVVPGVTAEELVKSVTDPD